jgi:hypothetical protein
MTCRTTGLDTVAALGSSSQARQVGLGSRLVQKNQPCRVEAALAPPPGLAGPREVGTILLAGAECLFLYVSPIFASTT